MPDLIQSAEQYGALGLVLLASFWYIRIGDKEQKEERQIFLEMLERQHEQALEVTRNNTTVLIEIATIIKNNKS